MVARRSNASRKQRGESSLRLEEVAGFAANELVWAWRRSDSVAEAGLIATVHWCFPEVMSKTPASRGAVTASPPGCAMRMVCAGFWLMRKTAVSSVAGRRSVTRSPQEQLFLSGPGRCPQRKEVMFQSMDGHCG